MTQVTLEEAQARLPELIEAAMRGDEIVIARNDQPSVKLTPIRAGRPRPRFGSARGKISMSDNFDEPLEDFKEYME